MKTYYSKSNDKWLSLVRKEVQSMQVIAISRRFCGYREAINWAAGQIKCTPDLFFVRESRFRKEGDATDHFYTVCRPASRPGDNRLSNHLIEVDEESVVPYKGLMP